MHRATSGPDGGISCEHCDAKQVDLASCPVDVDADEDGAYAVTSWLCESCADEAEIEWERRFPVDEYALHGVTRSDFI